MMTRHRYYGIAAMLGYAVLTALSSLFIHETNQQIPALVSAFYTFLFCFMIYAAFSPGLLAKKDALKVHAFAIIMLNVTTAICWILTFLALKFIPADLYLCVYLCAMPISACVFQLKKLIVALSLFFCLLILASSYQSSFLWLGVGLAFIGGTSGTIYSVYSKQVIKAFNTREILALRFYLTMVLTLAFSLYLGNINLMPAPFYLQFAGMALVSVVLPLTLFQVGIKKLPLSTALAFLPLASLLCYLMNFFLSNHFHSLQFSLIFLISILMLFTL